MCDELMPYFKASVRSYTNRERMGLSFTVIKLILNFQLSFPNCHINYSRIILDY
jgi:hypothetical protein